jgi:hypothetical protein
MPKNYIPIVPKGILELHGGTVEKVSTEGGNYEFLKLALGQRIYVGQQHRFVCGEMTCNNPRTGAYLDNFTIPA